MKKEDLMFDNHITERLFDKLCDQIEGMKIPSGAYFNIGEHTPQNGYMTLEAINKIKQNYNEMMVREAKMILVPVYNIPMV